MAFDIVVAPEAAQVLRKLPGHERALVKDTTERHLRHEPTKISKNRIKRLRGLSQPQYRLRVGDIRVFYDVTETTVEILAIVPKAQAQEWLAAKGTPTASGGSGASKG
jgi:mRNA-degrading endonuclease RelE of RelBE toxin-antitoxin system